MSFCQHKCLLRVGKYVSSKVWSKTNCNYKVDTILNLKWNILSTECLHIENIFLGANSWNIKWVSHREVIVHITHRRIFRDEVDTSRFNWIKSIISYHFVRLRWNRNRKDRNLFLSGEYLASSILRNTNAYLGVNLPCRVVVHCSISLSLSLKLWQCLKVVQ